jgi:hypothetical protein
VIAAALLLQAIAAPAASQVGPFVISTEKLEQQGFPYPVDLEVTSLRWKAPSGLASYELSDNGGMIELMFEVGLAPRNCLGRSGPHRLTVAPDRSFGRVDLLSVGCRAVLDARQAATLAREVRAARPYYAGAYRMFFEATIRQHGPLLERCRLTTMGYHGPDCAKSWDEGRSFNNRQKNKRNP